MPNLCGYEMKIVGAKDKVKEFIKVLQCNYDYNTDEFSFDRHFWRVFEADTTELKEREDGKYEVIAYGDCAWSVYSCMMDGEHTYQNDKEKQIEESDRVIINHGTTLKDESKNLGLDIQVFSTEPGCGFAEHLLYKQGEKIIYETTEYMELYFEDEEDMKEYNKEHDTNYVWEDYDEPIIIGGYWNKEIDGYNYDI